MKKIIIGLLLLGNVGLAEKNEILEIFFATNRNALELAKEICLEEKVYLTESFAHSCGIVGELLKKTEKETGIKLLMKSCDSFPSALYGEVCHKAALANYYLDKKALAQKYFKRSIEYLPNLCDMEYKDYQKSSDDGLGSLKVTKNDYNSNEGYLDDYGHLKNNWFYGSPKELGLVSGYYLGKSCYLLGKIYYYGFFANYYNLKKDENKALMYFERACEIGGKCETYNNVKKYLKEAKK